MASLCDQDVTGWSGTDLGETNVKADITIEADAIGDAPGRPGMQDRYQFIYRARNENDARKKLAKDEAYLKAIVPSAPSVRVNLPLPRTYRLALLRSAM